MSVPGPNLGPCESWITGDDVAACCDLATNPTSFDDVALEASMLLYELSGRLWSGLCERTVRPCLDTCACAWSTWAYSGNVPSYWTGWLTDWRYYGRGCHGDRCSCQPLSKLKLAGYPVREVTEVKIGGDVVDPSEYRLDGWRWLVRLWDEDGPTPRYWPGCQNLGLPDTEEGTWSVTYSWGVDPPPLGLSAAAELACTLYAACAGGECALPSNVTRIVRQGVEIDRAATLAYLARGEPTGLVQVDGFIAAYGMGYGRGARRPAVWSPDVPEYPRRIG